MNELVLKIQTIAPDEVAYIDESEFSNCCLVKVFIDGVDIKESFLPGGTVVKPQDSVPKGGDD